MSEHPDGNGMRVASYTLPFEHTDNVYIYQVVYDKYMKVIRKSYYLND